LPPRRTGLLNTWLAAQEKPAFHRDPAQQRNERAAFPHPPETSGPHQRARAHWYKKLRRAQSTKIGSPDTGRSVMLVFNIMATTEPASAKPPNTIRPAVKVPV
jgi:hypothetical protein